MESEGPDALASQLAALHARLNALADEQRAAIQSLREQIAGIEAQLPSRKMVVPEPVKPEVIPVVGEAKPVIVPPPLPVEVKVPVAVKPTPPPIVEKDEGFEMRLGRVWLVRFGVVLLLTGLVLLGNFAYKNWIREMPNSVRLLGLFLCAGALIETGRRLVAKTSLKKPGEVILAGGLSFFYYCTFASHHVARLKVIDSPVLAAVFLLGAAGLIVGVSLVRNAKATAVLGLLLASYSTILQPLGWLSCVSNVVLAGAGLVLMLRPGWSGPGVASMAGTYAAFFGWQIMGAAGGDARDASTMWFLVPVWTIFALPGLLDRFGESMGDRARAWFAGGNNAAFFTLFSLLWGERHGWSDYWMVCALFGGLLLAMGVLGRRRGQTVGGVNVFQGLALASLAMVVKLEGFHLVLGLGFESLALACAFARFRTRTEFLFSWLAGAVAMALGVIPWLPEIVKPSQTGTPLWSGGIAALLVAAASLVMRAGVEKCPVPSGAALRPFAGAMFFFAVALGILGWGAWLPHEWPAPVMAACAAGLSAAMFALERRWRMPEIGYGALVFLLAAAWRAAGADASWVLPVAGGFALSAAWMWHQWERKTDESLQVPHLPALHGWAYSAAVTLAALLQIVRFSADDFLINLIWLGGVSLLLLAFAIFTKTTRLAVCAALLNGGGLVGVLDRTNRPEHAACLTGFALAMLGLLFVSGSKLGEKHRVATSWILRASAFVGACWFWHVFAPKFGGDGLAITGGLLLAVAIWRKMPAMVEVWGFLGLSVIWLLSESVLGWGKIGDTATWRGWAVVLALWGLVVWTSFTTRGKDRTPLAVAGWAASILGSVWATQMLVWRHDWAAVSVLWTILGFALVSGGLGLRVADLRQAGFILLAMAVGKVFIVDVWDFNTFMRVVAFIVLGAAMILLGLFYNRFAPVLKKLLEEESDPQP